MKEWAEWFYTSDSWKQIRAAYMNDQNDICERCGKPAKICHHRTWLTQDNINDPLVALGWDNLEALCQTCHNQEHHKKSAPRRYSFAADGTILYPPHWFFEI